MGDWWYLENRRKEEENKRLKAELEELKQKERDRENEEAIRRWRGEPEPDYRIALRKCYDVDFFSVDEETFYLTYEQWDDEPDEDGYDVCIMEEFEIHFTLDEIIDPYEQTGLNQEKCAEIYKSFGTRVVFSFSDFLWFMKDKMLPYSDEIIW